MPVAHVVVAAMQGQDQDQDQDLSTRHFNPPVSIRHCGGAVEPQFQCAAEPTQPVYPLDQEVVLAAVTAASIPCHHQTAAMDCVQTILWAGTILMDQTIIVGGIVGVILAIGTVTDTQTWAEQLMKPAVPVVVAAVHQPTVVTVILGTRHTG